MLLRVTPKNGCKDAADENLPVRLHRGRENSANRAEIERLVESAILFHAGDPVTRYGRTSIRRKIREAAPEQDLAVRLDRNCMKQIHEHRPTRARIERIRQAGGWVEPRDVVSRSSSNGRKTATHQDFSIWLHCESRDTVHERVAVRARVE